MAEPKEVVIKKRPKVQSEKGVEAYLVERMRKLGGEAAKWVCPSRRGKPDRICLFPKGPVVFVELKTEGKQPSKEQAYEFQKMEDMGHPVFVVDTKKGVDALIKMYHEACNHE